MHPQVAEATGIMPAGWEISGATTRTTTLLAAAEAQPASPASPIEAATFDQTDVTGTFGRSRSVSSTTPRGHRR